MSETRPVRRFCFLYPGLILAGLALLAFLLPTIPQPGLRKRLEDRLRTTAAADEVKTGDVRLQAFPRPGIVVHDFSLLSPSLRLALDRLELNFSIFSLLSFKPEISGLQLAGGRLESSAAGQWQELSLLLEKGLAPLIPGVNLSRIAFADLTLRLPALPGMAVPVELSGLSGEFRQLAGKGNESLHLTAACCGGRLDLKTVWYNDAAADGKTAAGGGPASAPESQGVEVKARLSAAELRFSTDFKSSDQGFAELVCRNSDLDLDVNGNFAAGLRFSLALKTPDHSLTAFDENGERSKDISQGPLEVKGSGYLQPRAGYLNLKSAALVLPDAAVVYTRGLVRFREPFFVDLVSHLRVDDLDPVCRRFAGVLPTGCTARGGVTGDLKLVGNLFDMPVFKATLKAREIAVEVPAKAAASPAPEHSTFDSLLAFLADWEWLADCDCRIESLKWNDFGIRNFVLAAKKKTTQFEIERLAAEFEPLGEARLTLIVDDLLDNPRWQASMVAKGVDPSAWSSDGVLPAGRLDFSLVGGGACGPGIDYLKSMEFDGKWKLSHGKLSRQPLWVAFNRFLAAAGRPLWHGAFSGSGRASFRNNALGLNKMLLKFPGRRQISARGYYAFASSRFNFRGLIKEKGYQSPFVLEGTPKAPLFKK